MTRLLTQAVEKMRVLPDAMLDELAHVLLQLVGDDQPVIRLTAEEDAALDESVAQAERGEFATDENIRAIWSKHGL
ncbi:MAG: hypothetical protein QOJ54_1015 [Aliidongia sp.]|nr:hypothetical protein [Aliidongia sp.]